MLPADMGCTKEAKDVIVDCCVGKSHLFFTAHVHAMPGRRADMMNQNGSSYYRQNRIMSVKVLLKRRYLPNTSHKHSRYVPC